VDVSKADWSAVVEHTSDEWVLAHAADTAYRMGKQGKRFRAWSSGWRELHLPTDALTELQTQLLQAAAARELPDAAVRRWAAEGGTLPPLRQGEAAAAAEAEAAEAAAAGGACSAEELAAVPTGRGGVASQLQ